LGQAGNFLGISVRFGPEIERISRDNKFFREKNSGVLSGKLESQPSCKKSGVKSHSMEMMVKKVSLG